MHANEVPTEADNTLRAAIANASASLILFDIVIFHASKPKVPSAAGSRNAMVYSASLRIIALSKKLLYESLGRAMGADPTAIIYC